MDDITTVLCKRLFPSDKKCKKEYKLLVNGNSLYILLYNNGLLHITEAIPSQMIVIRYHISFTRVKKKAGHMKLLTCS